MLRNFQYALVLASFLMPIKSWAVDFCARIHPSVLSKSELKLNHPEIFLDDCRSNVWIVQEPDPRKIKIQGRDVSPMIFVSEAGEEKTFLGIPDQNFDQSMNQMCKYFLSPKYSYLVGSVSSDTVPDVEGVKIRTLGISMNLSQASTKSSPNMLVIKSIECFEESRDFVNSSNTITAIEKTSGQLEKLFKDGEKTFEEIQSRFHISSEEAKLLPFGKISTAFNKVAFVLDFSGSLKSEKCMGIVCQEYLLRTFLVQLALLPPQTEVNVYIYTRINAGFRYFPNYVSPQEVIHEIENFEARASNTQDGYTSFFFLDHLFNEDVDHVYVFSDFEDYGYDGDFTQTSASVSDPDFQERSSLAETNHKSEGPTSKSLSPSPAPKAASSRSGDMSERRDMKELIQQLRNAKWELTSRSFGKLDENSNEYIREVPDAYLGHTPER